MAETPVTRVRAPAPTARPVTRLDDLRVVLDPPTWGWWRDDASRERGLREWAKEIEGFLRDHRSQDPVSISVERVESTVCDQCGEAWEVADDHLGAGPYCAYCGVSVATEETHNA